MGMVRVSLISDNKNVFSDSEIKAFDSQFVCFFNDISSKLDPVKWRAEIQSLLRYMSFQK